MKTFKKVMKWLMIVTGILFAIVVALALIFNQITFSLISAIGAQDMYYGNNERGNEIISYAISKIDQPSAELYHSVSVQNTKNGNYSIAIDFLEKAMAINPQEVSRYYGWLLLYYYRDYEKALAVLEQNEYSGNHRVSNTVYRLKTNLKLTKRMSTRILQLFKNWKT